MKVAIIGNSGSGKTWLARRLAVVTSSPVVHLDELFWQPGGFDKQRSPEEVESLILKSKESISWVAEGVFGELAEQYLNDAELLVWLDMDWATCKKRLEERGSESKMHLGREQSEEGLRELIQWASHYTDRQDLRSYEGHRKLFDGFAGNKAHLRLECEVNDFLEHVQQQVVADDSSRRL